MAVLIHRSRNPKRGTLWQGGLDDVVSPTTHYDVIVLCADEFQPDLDDLSRTWQTGHQPGLDDLSRTWQTGHQPEASLVVKPGTEVVHAPNDDSEKPLTREQVTLAIQAARRVARAYAQGKQVLISCMQGRNRSGLVTALTLHLLYGLSGDKARAFIRSRVPNALTNPHFERFLSKVPARSAPSREARP